MIFDNKYYHLFMYIAIIITILTLLFYFTNLLESYTPKIKLSGLAIYNESDNSSSRIHEQAKTEVYSAKTYAFFKFILLLILITIIIIGFFIIMPQLKKYT